jgi:enamine deaminase RidA (YjgF/YER057c/UK114 family)
LFGNILAMNGDEMMANRTFFNAPDSHQPRWSFNEAVRIDDGRMLVVSAISGFEPDGSLAVGDLVRQAEAAFANLAAVLREAGATMADVVRVTVYLGEPFQLHRERLQAIRARYLTADFPASTLLQVAGFSHPDCLFQIEALAVVP